MALPYPVFSNEGENGPRYSRRQLEMRDAMMKASAEEHRDDYDTVIMDNTFARARDPDDGSLFELKEPHQIRPPAHTGIIFGEVGGVLAIDVQDPPRLPKYKSEACHLKTPHKLCLSCIDVFNYYCVYVGHLEELKNEIEDQDAVSLDAPHGHQGKRSLLRRFRDLGQKSAGQKNSGATKSKASIKRMRNSVIHHFNLFSLIARAEGLDGCSLCKTLLHNLKKRVPRLGGRRQLLESHRIETCWPRRQSMEKRSTLQFVLINMEAERSHWNNTHIYRLHVWPASVEESARATRATDRHSWFGVSDWTGDSSSKNSALCWMRSCVTNEDGCHDICNEWAGVNTPTRLLQISENGTQVRLICNTDRYSALPYVSLSHCWGAWGAKENPMLKQGNLASLQLEGLSVAKLPKTFRDAVDICGWFDQEYLWIDSLCIIQDSKEDWIREAAMMGDTYKHAWLNVSADHGEDSRTGCYVQRDASQALLMDFEATLLKTSFKLVPDPHFLFDWMQTSPSFSRAWIHRERQLSPRILHFTATELVWECCGSGRTCFRSELLPEGAPFDRLFNRDHKLQASGLVEKPFEGKREVLAQWQEACENLSRKHLTQPTDMPIVLAGIAKEFQASLPDEEYVGGLWRSTLPSSLLWNKDDALDKPSPSPAVAPSWSWLSAASAVKLAHRYTIDNVLQLSVVNDVHLEYAHEDPLGSLTKGSIQMTGHLQRIRFSYVSPHLKLGVYEPKKAGILRDLGEGWDEYEGAMFDYELDFASRMPEEGLDCHFLPITITAHPLSNTAESTKSIAGLLLKSTFVESQYLRCGTLSLTDMLALKMRYSVRAAHRPTEADWKLLQQRIRQAYDESRRDNEEAKRRDEKSEVGSEADAEDASGADTDNIYKFDQGFEPEWLEKVELRTITLV